MTQQNNFSAASKKKFAFDFNKAVEEAKRDYPAETRNLAFFNGSSEPELLEKLYEWGKENKLTSYHWDQIVDKADNSRSFSFPAPTGASILVIFPDRPEAQWAIAGDKDKSNQFSFDHELGHIIAPRGTGNQHDPDLTEHVADNFAALRGIKRGSLTKADLQKIADKKDAGFLLMGGLYHLTSMSLDALVINPKNTDFVSLSHQEIVSLAEKHATAFENTREADSKFFKIKVIGYKTDMTPQEECVKRMEAVTEICRTAPKDSKEFYLAARMLLGAIEKGEIDYLGHKMSFDNQSDHWQSVKKDIIAKAGDRDIGAKKAMESESFTRIEPEKGLIEKIRHRLTPPKI